MSYLPGTEQGVISSRGVRPRQAPQSCVIEHPRQSRTLLANTNVPTWKTSTYLFNAQPLSFSPADTFNLNAFPCGGKDYVIVMNTSKTQTHCLRLRSAPEPTYNRLGDQVLQIGPGQIFIQGPIPRLGYMQLDSNIWLDGSSCDLQLAVRNYS